VQPECDGRISPDLRNHVCATQPNLTYIVFYLETYNAYSLHSPSQPAAEEVSPDDTLKPLRIWNVETIPKSANRVQIHWFSGAVSKRLTKHMYVNIEGSRVSHVTSFPNPLHQEAARQNLSPIGDEYLQECGRFRRHMNGLSAFR